MSDKSSTGAPPQSWAQTVAALARESPRAYLIALRILGSPALAEEAVQDAYAKLIQRPPKFQDAVKDGYAQAVVYLWCIVQGLLPARLARNLGILSRKVLLGRHRSTLLS